MDSPLLRSVTLVLALTPTGTTFSCVAVAATLGACAKEAEPRGAAPQDSGRAPTSRPTDEGTLDDGAVRSAMAEAVELVENHEVDLRDAQAALEQFMASDYYRGLQPLLEFVEQRTVVDSESGNAGFVLRIDGDRWVAAYRDGDRVAHAQGTGEPPDSVRSAIRSRDYGDATAPIPGKLLDAQRRCDVAAELRRAHGETLRGLNIRPDAFDFSFRDDHRLEFQLVDDADGRPAFRVFWR